MSLKATINAKHKDYLVLNMIYHDHINDKDGKDLEKPTKRSLEVKNCDEVSCFHQCFNIIPLQFHHHNASTSVLHTYVYFCPENLAFQVQNEA